MADGGLFPEIHFEASAGMTSFDFHRHWAIILFHVLVIIHNLNDSTVLAANVTVDDTDPSIIYSPAGAWGESDPSPLDFGGTHKLTTTNGTASFTFTGKYILFFWFVLS